MAEWKAFSSVMQPIHYLCCQIHREDAGLDGAQQDAHPLCRLLPSHRHKPDDAERWSIWTKMRNDAEDSQLQKEKAAVYIPYGVSGCIENYMLIKHI